MFSRGLGPALAALLLSAASVAVAQTAADAEAEASADEPAAVPAEAPAPAPEALIYAVVINGRPVGDVLLLRLPDGQLLAPVDQWDRWHLELPATQYEYEGERYGALAEAAGFAARFDAQRQEARFDFSPRAFRPSVINASMRERTPPQPAPGLGGFLNYEAFATRQDAGAGLVSSNVNGLVETGLFNPLGAATSQWLGTNLSAEDSTAPGVPSERRVIRLETAITRDFPDEMQTLRLGDAVGAAGLWGRPVRFGGARWTRNFATQPGFVTVPQPALSGETALPSVLDIYVDGLRRRSVDVAPGPFLVENVPTLTGQGEVQVVVRDLLGREQVITDSYIAGVRQLRPGLHDYSYELGAVRERFGQVSDEYGKLFAAATHSYGFQDDFTGEARVELLGSDMQAAGLGAIFSLPSIAVISNAFAVSHGEQGFGAQNRLTLQRNTRGGLNAGAQLQLASDRFVQAGMGTAAARRTLGANLGYALLPVGRFGLSYVNTVNGASLPDVEAVTATFNAGFGRGGLSLFATHQVAPVDQYSGGLTLTFSFAPQHSAGADYRIEETDAGIGSAQSYARVQRSLPADEGWGYRVVARETQDDVAGDGTSVEAGVGMNARYGSYGLEAAVSDTVDSYRATIAGGLGTVGGHAFASRKITHSFAVVETGQPGIELLVDNRVAGVTDSDGVAVLPYLQPYYGNTVRIDAENVPIDIEIRSGEFRTAPYYRSGVVIPFDLRRTLSAVAALVQDDGSVVPAGAIARLGATGAEFPVGKRGEVYLSGLHGGDNPVEVAWNGHRCRATIPLAPDSGVQPQLGSIRCTSTP